MISEFLNALTEEREDKMTCTECADVLPEYIHYENQAQAINQRYDDIALHIKICPHCAQEYRELKELVTVAYTELLPEPESAFNLDLSFLPPIEEESTLPVTVQIRYWIIQLGDILGDAFRPASPLALAGVRSQEVEKSLFTHSEEGEDFKIEITGQDTPNASERCIIEVSVKIPSLGGPLDLDGITVQLTQDQVVIFEDETDPSGRVIFEEVQRDNLANLTCIIKADPEEQ